MPSFTDDNEADRLRFVRQWAAYVRTHDDAEWSRQQNVIINSALRSAAMTKEQYLAMKEAGKEASRAVRSSRRR